MKITEDNSIIVPKGIRYIGLWEDFELFDFPYILDKKLPGCGFTEYCITSPKFNSILCSPRKILLENKHDQHPDDTFLVVNEYDPSAGIDRDLVCVKPDVTGWDDEEAKLQASNEERNRVFQKIRKELYDYIDRMRQEEKPIKILVTYDSFRIIKDILDECSMLSGFRVIIDEFQSIFTDSRFKSSTELGFVTELQDVQKVCYVSATPMMKEYLAAIDEFKDLPYYELDWSTDDPGRIVKPILHVKTTRSVNEGAGWVVDEYLNGKYKKVYREDMSVVESKEAVIYVNSVNNICSIIRKKGLKPDQCNILVANTQANLKKINKKLGRKFTIGRVPLRGEPRKMFTFCTRTVYLGADFYSDNARSFIISDANIQTLAIDISLDLPQILGRQRLRENPWRNEAHFYYKSLSTRSKKKLSRLDFEKEVEMKLIKTEKLISSFNTTMTFAKDVVIEKYLRDIKNSTYKFDYVAIDKNREIKEVGKAYDEQIPVVNKLVVLAEKRAYDIQLIDYQDRFSVFSAIDSELGTEISDEIREFYKGYSACGKDLEDRLRYICELGLSEGGFDMVKTIVDAKTRSYLDLGRKLLKAKSYRPANIDRAVHDRTTNIDDVIYSEFKVGDKILMKDIKYRLQKIYDDNEMKSRKALALDLGNWFEMKPGKFKDDNGKWNHGFELLRATKDISNQGV